MFPRRFALIIGIFMLAVGAISLMPNMVGYADGLPLLKNENSYGAFLGLFPMNIFNKVALTVLGLGGIMAASARFTSLPASIHFSRLLFFATGALAILGLFPQTNTLNGYWPLFGNEIWVHAALAVLGGYFGYALTAKVPEQKTERDFKTPAHGLR